MEILQPMIIDKKVKCLSTYIDKQYNHLPNSSIIQAICLSLKSYANRLTNILLSLVYLNEAVIIQNHLKPSVRSFIHCVPLSTVFFQKRATRSNSSDFQNSFTG